MRAESKEFLQPPTALAYEAVMRLLRGKPVPFSNREAFFALCERQMRRLLADYGRNRASAKRRAPAFMPDHLERRVCEEVLIDLRRALSLLGKNEPRVARVIELTVFRGFSERETAQLINCSEAEVNRSLRWAYAWLSERLGHP